MSGAGEDADARLQRSISELFSESSDDIMSYNDNLEDDTESDAFTDAQESLADGSIEIIFEEDEDGEGDRNLDDEDAEDDEDDTETETEAQSQTQAQEVAEPDTAQIRRERLGTLRQLQALLGGGDGLQRILAGGNYRIVTYPRGALHLEEDDDDDDEYLPHRNAWRRRGQTSRRNLSPTRFPAIPNPHGRSLMQSGIFGAKDARVEKLSGRKKSFSERLLWRKLGIEPRSTARCHNRLIAQDLIPNTTVADQIIHYDSRAYSGQFSDDGNFFFSCTQNFKVQMYDTSNPYDWKYYKTVDFPFGQWTITDATLSPDNRFLAYSSIRHTVCLAPTDPNDHNEHGLLDFTNYAPGAHLSDTHRSAAYMGRQGFGIWSLRFSGDGREIVAGTSDHSVLVYDLETCKTTLKLRKHTDDVNAVCYGDKSSPHILFSGSDDQTLRVWDRRSMAGGREAGVFVGHTEGITYVDSKGDGRYVLSNGKDQMMKLWDLRHMTSPDDFDAIDSSRLTLNFDYRFADFNLNHWEPNPKDTSVVTFRGHSVLKTLIRCHFSPATSTNSRYVYSGSEDGKVYIWNLDGTQKATIDVGTATKDTRPRLSGGGHEYDGDMGYSNNVWKTCVRDASWSPTAPIIAATSWNGWGMSTGTVSVHSWNDSTFVPSAEDVGKERAEPVPAKRRRAYSPASCLPKTIGNIGPVDGRWLDVEDDGEPEMGLSYNAKLELRPGFGRSRAGLGANVRMRGGERGVRSNPVRARRSARNVVADDDEEDAGW